MCAKIVTVLNRKGGVGKTTLTIAIADTLISEHEADVTIVDLDPQATASQVLLTENEFTARSGNDQNLSGLLADLLEEPETKEGGEQEKHNFCVDGLGKISGRSRERLRLYPNSDAFWDLEADEIANNNGSRLSDAVKKFLQQEKQDRHYILVDCPPGQSMTANAILNASDLVICPMAPDPYSVWGKRLLKRHLDRIAPQTRYKFILNGFDGRLRVHIEVAGILAGPDHKDDMLITRVGERSWNKEDLASFDVNARVRERKNITVQRPLYWIYGDNSEKQLKKIVDAILKELGRDG